MLVCLFTATGCSFDPPPPIQEDGNSGSIDAPASTIDGSRDVDARDDVDAPSMPPDAAPPNVSTELGVVCTTNEQCPPDAPLCVSIGGSQMYCTLPCGTGTDPSMPPPDGNAICAAQYDSTSGTPVCAVNDGCPNNGCSWYCAIACGDNGGQNYGECPNGLTCSTAQNVCAGG